MDKCRFSDLSELQISREIFSSQITTSLNDDVLFPFHNMQYLNLGVPNTLGYAPLRNSQLNLKNKLIFHHRMTSAALRSDITGRPPSLIAMQQNQFKEKKGCVTVVLLVGGLCPFKVAGLATPLICSYCISYISVCQTCFHQWSCAKIKTIILIFSKVNV